MTKEDLDMIFVTIHSLKTMGIYKCFLCIITGNIQWSKKNPRG